VNSMFEDMVQRSAHCERQMCQDEARANLKKFLAKVVYRVLQETEALTFSNDHFSHAEDAFHSGVATAVDVIEGLGA